MVNVAKTVTIVFSLGTSISTTSYEVGSTVSVAVGVGVPVVVGVADVVEVMTGIAAACDV